MTAVFLFLPFKPWQGSWPVKTGVLKPYRQVSFPCTDKILICEERCLGTTLPTRVSLDGWTSGFWAP